MSRYALPAIGILLPEPGWVVCALSHEAISVLPARNVLPVNHGEFLALCALPHRRQIGGMDKCRLDRRGTERQATGYRSYRVRPAILPMRSEEHTSELQSLRHLVCRLLLEKK